jgi:hypothetical protein
LQFLIVLKIVSEISELSSFSIPIFLINYLVLVIRCFFIYLYASPIIFKFELLIFYPLLSKSIVSLILFLWGSVIRSFKCLSLASLLKDYTEYTFYFISYILFFKDYYHSIFLFCFINSSFISLKLL